MIELPLPPQPPYATTDPLMDQYLTSLLRWQEEMVRVVQSEINALNRQYDRRSDPVSIPPATVEELTTTPYKFRPATPENGGSRLAYAVDATGGAKVVYSDGSAWREIDGGAIVS